MGKLFKPRVKKTQRAPVKGDRVVRLQEAEYDSTKVEFSDKYQWIKGGTQGTITVADADHIRVQWDGYVGEFDYIMATAQAKVGLLG